MALRGSRNYERRKQCPNETNWSGRELRRQEVSGKGAGREREGRPAAPSLHFPVDLKPVSVRACSYYDVICGEHVSPQMKEEEEEQ